MGKTAPKKSKYSAHPGLAKEQEDKEKLRAATGRTFDEWVELARVYGGDPSRRLVNGVLGRVARDVAAEGLESHPGPRSTAVPDVQE